MTEIDLLIREVSINVADLSKSVMRGIKDPLEYHSKCGQIVAYKEVLNRLQEVKDKLERE